MIHYRELFIILSLVCVTTFVGNAQNALSDTTTDHQFVSKSSPFKNALRSTLVPGWGVGYATNGEKNGFSRTSKVFALFAGAYLAERVSQRTYESYLRETDFNKVDMRYNISNMSRQLSLGLIAAGVAVWSYDVVWVYRESKRRKKLGGNISVKLIPTVNQMSLTYAF